ncbi:hypothetical protein ACQY0O_000384 [Thecaphora frezii]
MDLVTDLLERVGLSAPAPDKLTLYLTSTFVVLTLPVALLFHRRTRLRTQHIPMFRERVLVLGASNERGVGEALALHYARRGCRDLVLVARNKDGLEAVKQKCIEQAAEGEEWDQSDHAPADETKQGAARIHIVQADCTDPHDVERLAKYVLDKLGGLDTLHICFGVSALLPLLGIAGVDPIRPPKDGLTTIHPSAEGLEAISAAVRSTSHVNVAGTAVCLAAFAPILQTTSRYPAIALTSSAAALLPAPTRSLYAATKAAQLVLFRSFAIECDAHASPFPAPTTSEPKHQRRAKIRFLAICPGTISTSFRHSAVDLTRSTHMPQDLAWVKGEKMLSSQAVAQETVFQVDRYAQGTRAMPRIYGAATWIEKIFPSYIQNMARKKYAY